MRELTVVKGMGGSEQGRSTVGRGIPVVVRAYGRRGEGRVLDRRLDGLKAIGWRLVD